MACVVKRLAVIDVGTNAVKILAADVTQGRLIPFHESSVQTRLGTGLYFGRRLRADAIRSTAEAVAAFSKEAARLGVVQVRCIATSAARDAENVAELLDAIKAHSGLDAEVITGEREAELGFQGVMTDPNLAAHAVLVIDVGGGSTEIILGDGAGVACRRSVALGTIRLAESFKTTDPPGQEALTRCLAEVRKFLDSEVMPVFQAAISTRLSTNPVLVGASGTSTVLARMFLSSETYDRTVLERVRLTRGWLDGQCLNLWSIPLEERRRIVGLPPNRADIIPFGVVIMRAVLGAFDSRELWISTRGLRFAVVKEMAAEAL